MSSYLIINTYDTSHNGIAIHLYDLKAIRMEPQEDGGHLIFEFNNAIILMEELESGRWVERSYRNEPVLQYYEDMVDVDANFKIWVEVWNDFVVN